MPETAVDINTIYAVYYRLKPRSSEAGIGRIVANSLDEAKRIAKEAVAKAYPTGNVMSVVLAKDSSYPVKNAAGEIVPPSMVN